MMKRPRSALAARSSITSAVLLLALFAQGARRAEASVIRHDVPDQAYLDLAQLPQFDSVGKLTPFPGATCSGTLISDRWVLTAAHCLDGAVLGNMSFELDGVPMAVSHFTQHPMWNGTLALGFDIGLIELAEPVGGIEPMALYSGSDDIGRTTTFVGFGQTGTGLTGAIPSSQGTKRGSMNTADATGSFFGGTDDVLLFDFDNPTSPFFDNQFGSAFPLAMEGLVGPGDSGGSYFIQDDDDVWKAIGVQSHAYLGEDGDGIPFDYGEIVGATRVSARLDWVYSVTGIPSPGAGPLLVCAGVLVTRRRR